MADTPKPHEPRRAEVLEALVELYLRLNGYFSIRNYLQHRAEKFGLETESDLLAIRMADQGEVLEDGRRQPNDDTLILSRDQALVDCVIAEVKEPSVEFNKRIRGPDGPKLISSALRMFGIFLEDLFKKDGAADAIANQLHAKVNQKSWVEFPEGHSAEHKASIRMLVFAPKTAKHNDERKHFDLQHVLDFTKRRMRPGEPCARYRDIKNPSASPWRGCTRLIVETFDDSHAKNEGELVLEVFVERVLSRWDNK